MRKFKALLPYVVLTVITSPIILGYIWITISTFSERTFGLIPVNLFTLENWSFLKEREIWLVTLNTFVLALGLAVGVVFVSSLSGYAISRMKFTGRKAFLYLTLLLHAFPSVTLLIAIYFVLRWISKIPVIGFVFGYNTIGGVTLVSISLLLPLGIWLMKGFFDTVPWDIERSALIDGCSRLRLWWQILLPQVKPGIFALSVFAFIQGWSSFLIPYSFMIEQTKSTIATYLNNMLSTTAPVDYSQVAAVGLFQLVPVILFFIFAQKYLLNVFTGGTKGGV